MNSVVKPRGEAQRQVFTTGDQKEMQRYGFIYADGTYSDEREMRGAYLVPRRPSADYMWDPDSREWYLDGTVMPPSTGQVQEPVAGQLGTRPPTFAEVVAANPNLEKEVITSKVALPSNG